MVSYTQGSGLVVKAWKGPTYFKRLRSGRPAERKWVIVGRLIRKAFGGDGVGWGCGVVGVRPCFIKIS